MAFSIVQRMNLAASALAIAAALGAAVAVLLTGGATNSVAALTLASRTVSPTTPGGLRTVTTHEVVTETVVIPAKGAAPSAGQASELRYVVKPGDTLWDIALSNYDDVGEGMQAIRRRNRLKRQKVLAGEVLVIPTQKIGDSH
jgi:LysM repeat protein